MHEEGTHGEREFMYEVKGEERGSDLGEETSGQVDRLH